MKFPTYLSIGHLCHDLHENQHILGGTASYAAIVAQKLGEEVAILTSVGDDFEYLNFFKEKGIPIQNQAAKATTVFENIYTKATRLQYIRQRADTIRASALPQAWASAPIVHLGLIANEIDFDLLHVFDKSLIGASIQGCLRQWDAEGKVNSCPMDWSLLKKADIVFISEDDIVGLDNALERILEYADHLVLTKGEQGATVFKSGESFHFPANPVEAIDPTGAGDVFATAYLIKYFETNSINAAAIFANCAASCVVEAVGLTGLDNLTELEKRVEDYRKLFTA